jgi:hypothetical protein
MTEEVLPTQTKLSSSQSMNRHRNLLVLLGVGGFLVQFAPPVSAATESFTTQFGSSTLPVAVNNFPIDLTLPQFNESLGSLTGIQLTLTTTGLLQSEVANVGPSATFSNAAASGTITVSGPEALQAFVNLSTTPFNGSIAAGTPLSPTFSLGPQTSLSGQGMSQVPLSDFGAFETGGAGGNFDFSLNADLNGSFSGNGPSGLSFAGDATAFGSVQVNYTYVSAVPEPGQLSSLSFFGFAAWMGIKRLRRNSPAKNTPVTFL